jgi:hypothetical protein
LWWDLVWIIPFTTQYNKNYDKYLFEFIDYEKYWLSKKSYLILNQFKIMSLKRLDRKLNDTKVNWIYQDLVNENILNEISLKLFEKVISQKQKKNP